MKEKKIFSRSQIIILHAVLLAFIVVLVSQQSVKGADNADQNAGLFTEIKLPKAVSGKSLNDVFFLKDGKKGWAVGVNGMAIRTKDGGLKWDVLKTSSRAVLRDVCFTTEKKGWACGDRDPRAPRATGHTLQSQYMNSGTVLIIQDGGNTWKSRWVSTNFQLTAIEPGNAPVLQLGNAGDEAHLDGDNLSSRRFTCKSTWNSSIGKSKNRCRFLSCKERRLGGL